MINYFISALVVGFFGGFLPSLNFTDDNKNIVGAAVHGVLTFLLTWFFSWLFVGPFQIGPFWGYGAAVMMASIINSVVASAYLDVFIHGAWWSVILLVVILVRGSVGSAMFNAEEYRNLLLVNQDSLIERDWSKDIPTLDLSHVRVISEEQASWLADKKLGEAGTAGSQFHVSEMHIQLVQGDLYWVAPLEFDGYFAWSDAEVSPGYIMVNAETRNNPATIVDTFSLAFMKTACFGKNLERYLYQNGYSNTGLTEYTFELDDDFNPYWVVTLYHPTIQYGAETVDGIVVVNAETGEIQEFTVGETPDWIDRVYPESFIQQRVADYGEYVRGYWNLSGKDEMTTSTTDLRLVYGADRKPYWFVGLTSNSAGDDGLIAFMLVSSQTGEIFQYNVSGSTERGVLEAVNEKVSNFSGYHGVDPILYNVNAEPTWIVPVVGENHQLNGVAFVRASDATVAFKDNLSEAYQKYQSILMSANESELSSKRQIMRKSNLTVARKEIQGNHTYFIFNEEPGKVFVVSNDISPEVIMANAGDSVTVEYAETELATVPVRSFDNTSLDIER